MQYEMDREGVKRTEHRRMAWVVPGVNRKMSWWKAERWRLRLENRVLRSRSTEVGTHLRTEFTASAEPSPVRDLLGPWQVLSWTDPHHPTCVLIPSWSPTLLTSFLFSSPQVPGASSWVCLSLHPEPRSSELILPVFFPEGTSSLWIYTHGPPAERLKGLDPISISFCPISRELPQCKPSPSLMQCSSLSQLHNSQ